MYTYVQHIVLTTHIPKLLVLLVPAVDLLEPGQVGESEAFGQMVVDFLMRVLLSVPHIRRLLLNLPVNACHAPPGLPPPPVSCSPDLFLRLLGHLLRLQRPLQTRAHRGHLLQGLGMKYLERGNERLGEEGMVRHTTATRAGAAGLTRLNCLGLALPTELPPRSRLTGEAQRGRAKEGEVTAAAARRGISRVKRQVERDVHTSIVRLLLGL